MGTSPDDDKRFRPPGRDGPRKQPPRPTGPIVKRRGRSLNRAERLERVERIRRQVEEMQPDDEGRKGQ